MNILKYPGAKWTIAKWIIEHFPENYESMTYCEPFFGSGSVFFNKRRSIVETINDLDMDVVNLFKAARDNPDELIRKLELTPWSRSEYAEAYDRDGLDDIERARRFIVKMWQGIGSKTADKTGWRNNIKGSNGNVARFHQSLLVDIKKVTDRLKHSSGNKTVQIENQNAFQLIERYNRENVLMYIDPPYVMSTRNNRIYKHEFDDSDHERLLDLLNESKAKIVLSGYDCELYQEKLSHWKRYSIMSQTEFAKKKEEVIWLNYEPPFRLF